MASIVTKPTPEPKGKLSSAWKYLAPFITGIVILLIPVPAGLKFSAWCFFALFAAVMVGVILEPIPAGVIPLVGVGLATILGLVERKPGAAIAWGLSGFSNTTVWLIFAAFMFAIGYEKTGLGRRIALGLVKALGSKTLGLGYAIMLSDLILAPVTPSNTARSAGTIFPIIRNIPPLYDSYPGPSARKIGSYVMWTALASTCVTGSMFMTAVATNLLCIELVKKIAKVEVTWSQWAYGFLPIGVFLMATLPWLIYKIYPPEIKTSKEVSSWAANELLAMGKISKKEIGMALLVTMALIMWIFGRDIADASTVAILVVGLMVVTRIVTWDDVLGNKPAWNVLMWFATLVALADGLARVGFIGWVANVTATYLKGVSPMAAMAGMVALYFFIHYMFANLTAQAVGTMPMILAAGIAIPGMPVRTFSLLMLYALGLMGIITPYACGAAPDYYASGYIERKDFWVKGFIFGMIFLGLLLGVGIPWLGMVKP
ncbi:MAG: anion permease [Candidatus Korobacteraceae bacterium]|jgi:L-tartrate/succinate antiporter